MTLTIELEPEVEAAINRQAALRGEDTATYVQHLVQQTANQGVTSYSSPESLTIEERMALLDEVAREFPGVPPIPDEYLRREYLYAERDERQR